MVSLFPLANVVCLRTAGDLKTPVQSTVDAHHNPPNTRDLPELELTTQQDRLGHTVLAATQPAKPMRHLDAVVDKGGHTPHSTYYFLRVQTPGPAQGHVRKWVCVCIS